MLDEGRVGPLHDLLLKGGTVIDPSQNRENQLDVAFRDGKISALAQEIPKQQASRCVDVTGRLVIPGLIDAHGHFAHRISPYGADADLTCLRLGVPTAIDAGTLGWVAFPAFRAYIIDRIQTRLFSFLYLSSLGNLPVASGIPDLADLRLVQVDEMLDCMRNNSDVIVGVKVRLAPLGAPLDTAIPALTLASQVASQSGTRVMAHVMDCPIPLSDVLQYLRPGDIISHAFHGTEHGILDQRGKIRKEVWAAYDAGVLLDTACFMRHFSIPTCLTAIKEGLFPHFLSTDWVGPWMAVKNYSLLEIMSMFLELGMSLRQVVAATTSNPATILPRRGFGSLAVGSIGDAVVLQQENGAFQFEDMLGNTLISHNQLKLVSLVKDGKMYEETSGEVT